MIGIVARIGALCVASVVPHAVGDQIRIEANPWQSGSGGEFRIRTVSGFAGVNGLASDIDGSTFQTFCLERGTFGGTPGLYDYTVSTGAVSGGQGGGNPDPISYATAYLFNQFRTGALSGYAYTGTDPQRQVSADALQIAIWTLEDEYPGGVPVNAQAAQWVADAIAAVAGSWGQTLGGVRVLNLTQAGNERQDVLTLIPLPAAAWMGLAGLAVLPVIRARRRASQGS